MPVAGYVTRSGGSTFFSQSPNNPTGTGGVKFLARRSDGSSLGGYEDAGQAIRAFKNALGARFFQARRQNLPGLTEQYVIISSPLDPGEIWGTDDSIIWVEPSFPTKVQLSDVMTKTVRAVLSLVGGAKTTYPPVNLIQNTLANQGSLSQASAKFNGRDVLVTAAPAKGYATPALTTLAPPYSIVLAANANVVGLSQTLVSIDVGGSPLLIGDDGAGNWLVTAGAGAVATGVPISTGPPDIITVASTTTTTSVRVNQVPAGSTANVAGSGTLEIGGLSTDTWNGSLAFLFIGDEVDADAVRVIQTERYAIDRYR